MVEYAAYGLFHARRIWYMELKQIGITGKYNPSKMILILLYHDEAARPETPDGPLHMCQ